MRRSILLAAILPLALVVVLASSAAADEREIVQATVSFDFTAGKTALPAGTYQIMESISGGDPVLMLRAPKRPDIILATITRLAMPNPPDGLSEPKLVFDEIGGKSYLSEVWPLDEDGFLINNPGVAHTHKTVKGVKKARPRT